MKYTSDNHQKGLIQLNGTNFIQPALYFITIVCANKHSRFGNIVAEQMQLNEFGIIATDKWMQLSQQYVNCILHDFVVMPNHVHGVIQLLDPGVRTEQQKTIAEIVAFYKSQVSLSCLSIFKTRNEVMGKLWQRDHNEQLIGDQRAYDKIINTIKNNPSRWHSDDYYVSA